MGRSAGAERLREGSVVHPKGPCLVWCRHMMSWDDGMRASVVGFTRRAARVEAKLLSPTCHVRATCLCHARVRVCACGM